MRTRPSFWLIVNFLSQINSYIKKYNLKYPIADLKVWSRIFAIGPKKNKLTDVADRLILEAIDKDNMSYHMDMLAGNPVSVDIFFQTPRQFTIKSDFVAIKLSEEFDTERNKNFNTVLLISKSGISPSIDKI